MKLKWVPIKDIERALERAQSEGEFTEVAFIFDTLERRAKILREAVGCIQCGIVRPAKGNADKIALDYVETEKALAHAGKILNSMFAGMQQSIDHLQVN